MRRALLEPIANQTLCEVATNRLRDAITRGVLAPGAPLIERELAQSLQVSRIPVREAIHRLAEEGLVTKVSRRGAFVYRPSRKEIEEITSLRIVLESFVVERTIAHWSPEHEARLRDIVEEMRSAAQRQDTETFFALDHRFHEALWEVADHGVLMEVLATLWKRLNRYLFETARSRMAACLEAGLGDHGALLDALNAGDVGRAQELMVRQILPGRSRAAAAPPPPAELPQREEIGSPGAPGSTTVEDGIFTLQGSGIDIWDTEDHFHFAYQKVRGDGSITARLLSAEGGHDIWSKAGVMIRAGTAPGSRNALLFMSSGEGVEYQWRLADDERTYIQRDLAPRAFPLYLRMQRVGEDFAGFVSEDGRLWRALTVAPTIPMPEEALFGLAVTSHADDQITTARFDQVTIEPGVVAPTGLQARSGDREILLTWNALPNAVGYHVFRGAPDAAWDQLARLTPEPISQTEYADSSPGLENGRPLLYAVAPVLQGDDVRAFDGATSVVLGTPVAAPPGYRACSAIEGANTGSVLFDPASGTLTLRASGGDIWDAGDQGYFVYQEREGDFRITVRALSLPSYSSEWAKSGIMVRETLDPGARTAYVYVTAGMGLVFQWRPLAHGHTALCRAVDAESLRVPILLRLTRRGNAITAEFSRDEGKTFALAGAPYLFERELPARVYAGLAATAHNSSEITEATLDDLKIEEL
jgi:DNA-binding GntR family transcriptional regulator/regulation of enolase protein 1 (concanavalin A-like superfamily)